MSAIRGTIQDGKVVFDTSRLAGRQRSSRHRSSGSELLSPAWLKTTPKRSIEPVFRHCEPIRLVFSHAGLSKARLDDGDRFRMLSEEEQGTDPESITKWVSWFDSREPLKMTQAEEAAMNEWRAKMKTFNVEAVRRQMEEEVQ